MQKKHKENIFLEKFSLLNSQEYTEDIKWSSSSSSEYDETPCNTKLPSVNKTANRKRKRRKKLPRNLSNLDITIIDTPKDNKRVIFREKSPIIMPKNLKAGPVMEDSPDSPILPCKVLSNVPNSPIVSQPRIIKHRSPILPLKSRSPKHTMKVRKKLYEEHENIDKQSGYHSAAAKLNANIKLEAHDTSYEDSDFERNTEIKTENDYYSSINTSAVVKTSLNGSEKSLQAKINLMNKVKNYFDSQFSSDTTSQNICDTPTPDDSGNKNEDIEILSCKTQSISSLHPIKQESTSNSDILASYEKNTKKTKYKKGGLAHRLHTLLKIQNAHVSLWQHERFLADNSNFVIPKGEHMVFYIQKVDFKYGCYLIKAVDVKDDKYFVLISSLYVNSNISCKTVLKLYEPYNILDFDNNCRVIVNICKFECIVLEKI